MEKLILNEDVEMFDDSQFKNLDKDWYGIEGARYINHGSFGLDQILYNGYYYFVKDLYQYILDSYIEDTNDSVAEDEDVWNWLKDNSDAILSAIANIDAENVEIENDEKIDDVEEEETHIQTEELHFINEDEEEFDGFIEDEDDVEILDDEVEEESEEDIIPQFESFADRKNEAYISLDNAKSFKYDDQILYRLISTRLEDGRTQMFAVGIGKKIEDDTNGYEPVIRSARYTTEESFLFLSEEKAYKFLNKFKREYPDADTEGLHVAEYNPLHPVIKLVPITSPCGNAYIGLQKLPKKDDDKKDESLEESKKRKLVKVRDGGAANEKGGSINNAFFNRAMGHPVDAGDFAPASDGMGDAGGEACCGESLEKEDKE